LSGAKLFQHSQHNGDGERGADQRQDHEPDAEPANLGQRRAQDHQDDPETENNGAPGAVT